MTDVWAAFVAARLDEDEAVAKAAQSVAGPAWKAETYWPEDESRTRTCVRSEDGAFLADLHDTPDYPDLATHIARHDPGRVLREVAAKRAILAAYQPSGYGVAYTLEAGPEFAVHELAAAWSDHADYPARHDHSVV